MPAALFPFMRIVVDVMGGDHGISVVINGVSQALQAYPHISELHLVGLKAEIEAELARRLGTDTGDNRGETT